MNSMLWTLSTAAALLLSGCAAHQAHWDYAENGPTHWSEFSRTCGRGHAQSPINIQPGKTVSLDPDYVLHLDEDIHTTAHVIDNGHSIQVTPKAGAKITLNGEEFALLQFHFHGKSEHTVNGKRYDMVAHFVHQNLQTKQLAVIAVFFEEGANNPVLDNILGNIGEDIRIDPQDLLPSDVAHYYHYVGSLTTPPCSENIQWFLLKQPDTASKDQIDAFHKYYVDNERPIQEPFDRQVETN